MKIYVLTLFPDAFVSFISHSIVKRALAKKSVSIQMVDLRKFTADRHRTCDDKPFGGGPGMLLKPEPIFKAVEKILGKRKAKIIYPSPCGERFTQSKAQELAACKELVFICGHYEGVDQRVVDELVTDEISIGDYVLTGGELAAMVVMDSVIRLLKGAVGNEDSKAFESFSQNLLEYPQYTRPASYRGFAVPPVLLTGNHKVIERWRLEQARRRTRERRPDLLKVKAKK